MKGAETRVGFRARLTKRWRTRLARECLNADQSFPLEVSIQKPTFPKGSVSTRIVELRNWLEDWEGRHEGIGVEIRIDTVKKDGYALRIPHSVKFAAPEALASFLCRDASSEWRVACRRIDALRRLDPRLSELCASWITLASLPEPDWAGFLGLLAWRINHPDVSCFIREIPVPSLHTKWVEGNSALVLKALKALDLVDPDGSCFAAMAKFRHEDTRTLWVRLPADGMLAAGSEIALRPSSLIAPPVGTERVLIVENLTTFRSIRPAKGTLLIFGSGNEFVSSIRDLHWMQEVQTFYWGDADLGGYEILGRLRARHGSIKSILMDCKTITDNAEMIVPGPVDRKIDQTHLTDEERAALQQVLACGGRLEQERLKANLTPLLEACLAEASEGCDFALAS